ncbi:hypothetical protein CR513_39829, partial [Mucuna pruriens]
MNVIKLDVNRTEDADSMINISVNRLEIVKYVSVDADLADVRKIVNFVVDMLVDVKVADFGTNMSDSINMVEMTDFV